MACETEYRFTDPAREPIAILIKTPADALIVNTAHGRVMLTKDGRAEFSEDCRADEVARQFWALVASLRPAVMIAPDETLPEYVLETMFDNEDERGRFAAQFAKAVRLIARGQP